MVGVGLVALVPLGSSAAQSAKAKGGGIVCALEQVKDAQRSGLVAFTYLLPKGWSSHNSLTWNPSGTYQAEFIAETPDGQCGVDQLEPINMIYTAATGMAPQGAWRLNHATDFLNALIGRIRQNGKATNIKVVEQFDTTLPETDMQKLIMTTKMYGGMSQSVFHEAGYAKITFEINGVEETASLGTSVVAMQTHNNLTSGFGNNRSTFTTESGAYVVGPTLLVIVPVKASASRVKEGQIIASSVRKTPQFNEFEGKLALQMAQAGAQAALENSRRQNQQMQDRHESLMADFRSHMAAKDASTHDFCNYILDRQDFKSSNGTVVTMPTTYNHAWTNAAGQYVLSDDPTYDPKGTGAGGWEKLQRTTATGELKN